MRDSNSVSTATAVTVRVVYLARLHEAFGCEGEALAVAAPATIADVVSALRRRGGAWESELSSSRAVRFARNHALCSVDTTIADGDEIALLPPVTGG
jgi:molybdopterin synthase sulfur carrier subunit